MRVHPRHRCTSESRERRRVTSQVWFNGPALHNRGLQNYAFWECGACIQRDSIKTHLKHDNAVQHAPFRASVAKSRVGGTQRKEKNHFLRWIIMTVWRKRGAPTLYNYLSSLAVHSRIKIIRVLILPCFIADYLR